jgi:hypothetical protein
VSWRAWHAQSAGYQTHDKAQRTIEKNLSSTHNLSTLDSQILHNRSEKLRAFVFPDHCLPWQIGLTRAAPGNGRTHTGHAPSRALYGNEVNG